MALTARRMDDVLDRLAQARRAVERAPLAPNVGALFDAAVARYGDRPLWVDADGGASLSYAAFNAEVTRCVGALNRLGVTQGTHVALMLPSVPALAITWMALAKLGAVMLPVNTRYTAPELAHVLRTGDAEFLIIDATHRDLIEGDHAPALPRDRIVIHDGRADSYVGEWRALLDDAGALPALPPIDPDALMTLQFTSGSTGAPKACMLPHLYWTTIAAVRAQQGPPVTRMLVDMPFHYMGGQWRFLLALMFGATAYVARQPSLTKLIDRLVAHDIEFCSVTPALAKQALDPRRKALKLRWAGTMALPADLHHPLEAQLGGAPVREMYGLTETGAALAMPVEVDWMTGSGAIGLPVPFRTLRIVDAAGKDVPPGATGELLISGPGMMRGYYKRDDATREVFRDGWFRSGDLFRRDADGFFTIVGRIKDVIRRSGENISATEIEAALCAIPEITEAAAIGVPDAKRGEELKVCVVLKPGLTAEDLPPQRIMKLCRARLARFKLPRYISYHADLPKTPSGKIAKPDLRPAGADPRLASFDTEEGIWR
ncbi:MAG TPA: class I adenylate-forming enzyme family protein [Pseudolabrys sp.]|nr:class I adenylate-forming enzyme family protein [Pseudolabrys sp.]